MQKLNDSNLRMMKKSERPYYVIGLICLIMFLAGGCENTFEPFNEDEGFYSIYGNLNLYADTNFVRVKNLNIPLYEDSTRQFDATVTLKNLNTGTSLTMTDSLIEFEGVLTHNFYTDADIAENSEYQVAVEGPDGKSARISTTTPYDSNISVDPGKVQAGCNAQVAVSFKPYMKLSALSAEISFKAINDEDKTQNYRYVPEIDFTESSQQGVGTKIAHFTPIKAISAQYGLLGLVEEDANPCTVLRSDIFTLNFRIYEPGFDETVSDSIQIPGGEGRFVAYADSIVKFRVPAVTQFIEE